MTIKELREKTGLTQYKFATKFKVHPANISGWERKVSTPPEYVTYMMERILDLEEENEELRSQLFSED